MKTKIVYVLVSKETDYYYEMVLLSLYSFRLYHPKDLVELVMDEDTHQRLLEKHAEILKDVTPIVVHVPDEYDGVRRSRFLKTRLRQIVQGAFLYLDCDTLVCGSLEGLDNLNADIAMADDTNAPGALSAPERNALCKKAGFTFSDDQVYYNSGVILVKDNALSRSIFDTWHRLWLVSLQRGVPQDQPALCQANIETGEKITRLCGIWNCQIKVDGSSAFISKAKIVHYYISSSHPSSAQVLLFENIKERGGVGDAVGQVARNPRTTGVSLFSYSMNEERLLTFLFSYLLHVYDFTPPLFRLFVSISHMLVKPIRALSRIKLAIKNSF